MAEEQKPEPEAQASDEAKSAPSINDLMTQLDAIKQAQSGSDRKVAELSRALMQAQKEKDDLLKQSMTEKQRFEFELEQREKAAAAKEAELHAKDVALQKADVVSSLEVPKRLAKYIVGESRDEMERTAKELMADYKAELADAVTREVNKRLLATGGPKPEAGDEQPAATDFTARMAQIMSMPPGPKRSAALDELQKTLK